MSLILFYKIVLGEEDEGKSVYEVGLSDEGNIYKNSDDEWD